MTHRAPTYPYVTKNTMCLKFLDPPCPGHEMIICNPVPHAGCINAEIWCLEDGCFKRLGAQSVNTEER